jgi:sortase (surface protein transpeptidase)
MFWGQKIFVHAWDLKYVYEIRTISWWTSPTDLRAFKHEEYDWITLVTCRGYEEDKDRYRWRTVVRAVLVDVLDE